MKETYKYSEYGEIKQLEDNDYKSNLLYLDYLLGLIIQYLANTSNK